MNKANDNILVRKKITLSERDWKIFIESLDEDREPTEAAKKAATRYNEGTREGIRNEWQPRP